MTMYASLFDQLRLFPGSNRERLRHGLVGELRALDCGLIRVGQERPAQFILAPDSLAGFEHRLVLQAAVFMLDDIIIRAGTASAGMYFVKDRVVAMERQGAVLMELGEGDLFGEAIFSLRIVPPRRTTSRSLSATSTRSRSSTMSR